MTDEDPFAPARRALARTMTETAWQSVVTDVASLYGWRWYHPPDNMPRKARSGYTYVQNVRRGFPDLVLVKPPRLLFVELKKQTGKTTPEQEDWIADLRASGVRVEVWRPLDEELVRAVLGPEARGW